MKVVLDKTVRLGCDIMYLPDYMDNKKFLEVC